MKTTELEGPLLDYHVALAMGHVWRRPRDEFEGYNAWQAYEQAFGNPTPTYSTDWAVGGPVIDRERITIKAWDDGSGEWTADVERMTPITAYSGPTPLIAAMRVLVAFHFGQDVPDVKL